MSAAGLPDPVRLHMASLEARSAAVPKDHLRYVLGEAERAFARGDFQAGLTNLCHAVFVAGTTGREGMSELDLIRELRKVAGFGFDVDEVPCP